MRKLVSVTVAVAFLAAILSACSTGTSVPSAADGLDLHAVSGLVGTATHAEHLEMLLNQPGGVNNLDLDGNGEVDHIHVMEYGDGNFRGFSLYVWLSETSKQQVAEITFRREFDGGVVMQIQGNPQIYGPAYYLTSQVSMGAMPFLVWAFMPSHVAYISPYYYGYYPVGYVRVRVVPVVQYRTVTQPIVKEMKVMVIPTKQPIVQSTVKSPNADATAPQVKAKLANPTETQKQFQVEEKKKPLVTTGFGKDKNPATVPETASRGEVKPGTLAKPAIPEAGKVGDAATTEKQFEVTKDKKPLDIKGFGKAKDSSFGTEKLPAPKITAPAPSVPSPAPKSSAPAPKVPSGKK